MNPREVLEIMVRTNRASMTVWSASEVRDAINAYRDSVLNGTELNPSPLVRDAQAYRWLADEISKTMGDPNRWDGDESEEEILARYVRWLAAERDRVVVETIRGDADWLEGIGEHFAASMLRHQADGEPGEAVPGKASSPEPTATQPDPLAYGPTGYPCGCGKDAHSNLTPCAPDNPAPADFFQPLLTYVRQHHGEYVLFTVASVATGPGHTYPTAFGWRKVPGEDWEPSDTDDITGWTALDDEPVHPLHPVDFFQPGHGYTHRKGTDFRCIAVTTHPNTGEPRAFGWVVRNGWHEAGALDPDDWTYNYDGCEPPADDHGSMEDVFTASELHEMSQDAEYRMDAADEERDAERDDEAARMDPEACDTDRGHTS